MQTAAATAAPAGPDDVTDAVSVLGWVRRQTPTVDDDGCGYGTTNDTGWDRLAQLVAAGTVPISVYADVLRLDQDDTA